MKQSFVRIPYYAFFWVLVFLQNYPGQVMAQGGNYGVNSPIAIGKFLNDSLPSLTPSNSSTEVNSWTVENAFPNIDFLDPLDMRHYPGTNRFLVAGKGGHIWTFENNPNASSKTMFLDLSDSVKIAGDGGLLGVIFHPEFGQSGSPNRGYVYIYYRYLHDRSISHLYQPAYLRLSRFTVPDNTPFQADPNSELVMIQQYDQHEWHNGGSMFFGPVDSMLYLIVGDEGGANDEFESAQKLDLALMSGILRLDVDQRGGSISHPIRRQPQPTAAPLIGWPPTYSQGYFIPNDNPWVNPDSSVLEEFWAIGMRSPHRMWYDPPTGDIWFGDIGQGQREEISIVHKGDNAQWPYREGNRVTGKPVPSPLIGTDTPPLLDYPRTDGSSVIGGVLYRGAKWANSLGGKYIFSDNVVQTVWTVDYYNTGSNQKEVITTIPFETDEWKDGVAHIYTDSAGEVYILQLAGHRTEGGKIYKLASESESLVPIQAPSLLSQTGAFSNLATLAPSPGVIPYEPNITFWSDSSLKKRWLALPNDGTHDTQGEQIQFSEDAEWTFPNGTVFIKHFDFPIDETTPGVTKKIETRFVVKGDDGIHYFLTYRWREDESDADLVTATQGEDRILNITTASGTKQQTWHYPSNSECITCHNSASKQVLGINTRQMNGDLLYPGTGNSSNQLATMNHLNWFYTSLDEANISSYDYLSSENELNESLEQRARSYLDVNCAYCHRPGGLQTSFDFRYSTPIANQGILNGNVGNTLGIQGAKLVIPGDTSRSIVYQRLKYLHENVVMPPLGKSRIDEVGKKLIADWINSLDEEAPTVPTGLVAINVQDSSIHLSWNSSTDNIEVTGYQVFQDGSSQPIATVDTPGILLTGLTPLTTYLFAIAAYDSAGNVSNQSVSIAVQTLPSDPCNGTAPVSITSAGPFPQDAGAQQLSATPTGGTWSGSADVNGIFDPNVTQGNYEVYYAYDFGGGCIKEDTITVIVGQPTDPCFGTEAVSITPAGPFAQDAGAQQLTAT
ncbi:MAG: PQQ-dependent sugar dehydrogenase, partial [Bacteroidota bacterium]